MIDFLNPVFYRIGTLSISWFVIGALAALIPLIIHLSRSKRTKKMRFSTTRFFTDQFLRSYRMSRLKELLLLACRMLVCGLLAMALAQPLWLPRGNAFMAGQSSGPRSVVLVIDNSASMAYQDKGVSLFERARSAARDMVEGLRPGDTATVVLAGRREAGPEVLFAEPTPDRGDVLQALNSLQVAALGTDLSAAVHAAEAIRFPESVQSKEIYVFSDLQDAAWTSSGDVPAGQSGSDLMYFFVQVKPAAATNAAVTAVQHEVARPMIGVPFAIRPHVVVQGVQTTALDIRLYVDGKKVSERKIEKLEDGRWATPRFYHTFTTGGWHSGYVEVQDEALTLDNRRYFAVEVLDAIKVLAVNGAASQVERFDELFFVKKALNPDGTSPIRIDETPPADLPAKKLEEYGLVILANVEALTVPAVEKLEAFVDQGGSLLVFLGDKVNGTIYNQNLVGSARLHGGLLPATLKEVAKDPKGAEDFARIADAGYSHFVLSAFQDPKFGDLTGVTFKSLWQVEPADGADVLMRASTGAPLLCEKAFGKGRVLLFTSTCDRDWTNFPARVTFLPFIHRLVGYLALKQAGKQSFYATGDSVPIPVSATEGIQQVLVKKPDEKVGYVTPTNDPARPLVFNDTVRPGVYTVNPDKEGRSPLFAVNLESYESKLSYLDDELAGRDDPAREAAVEAGLKEKLGPGRPSVSYIDDPSRVREVSLAARRGSKLWDIALWIVLILSLFEPWLANRISVRHYARPTEISPSTPRGESSSPAGRPAAATQEVLA